MTDATIAGATTTLSPKDSFVKASWLLAWSVIGGLAGYLAAKYRPTFYLQSDDL